MEPANWNVGQLVDSSKHFARTLFTMGENRRELLMIEMQEAGIDGVLVFLFFFVEIGEAGSVFDIASPIGRLGFEQDRIREGGLAGHFMADERNGVNIAHSVF